MYLVQRSDTSCGVYDCICTASCGYYPRVATMKAAAINGKLRYVYQNTNLVAKGSIAEE